MPADGDVLLALVAGCAEGGNAASAVKKMEAACDAYFSRVQTLRKTAKSGEIIIAAADAKKEGGILAKVLALSLKHQVSLRITAQHC
jgi:hypothetical protein